MGGWGSLIWNEGGAIPALVWGAALPPSQTGNVEAAEALLQHNAAVNAQLHDGWTALMLAAESGHSVTAMGGRPPPRPHP